MPQSYSYWSTAYLEFSRVQPFAHATAPQVADFAMLPQKDTRELLYQMLRSGFVTMQAGAMPPSRTMKAWPLGCHDPLPLTHAGRAQRYARRGEGEGGMTGACACCPHRASLTCHFPQ